MLILHTGLVVARLGRDPATREAGTRLAELFFEDMDRTLREDGVGDVAVPKRIKKIAAAFYGRLTAYETAPDRAALVDAVARNVYDGRPPEGAAEALATYIGQTVAALSGAAAATVAGGALPWPPVRGRTTPPSKDRGHDWPNPLSALPPRSVDRLPAGGQTVVVEASEAECAGSPRYTTSRRSRRFGPW